jgi:hypothetical protein
MWSRMICRRAGTWARSRYPTNSSVTAADLFPTSVIADEQ